MTQGGTSYKKCWAPGAAGSSGPGPPAMAAAAGPGPGPLGAAAGAGLGRPGGQTLTHFPFKPTSCGARRAGRGGAGPAAILAASALLPSAARGAA